MLTSLVLKMFAAFMKFVFGFLPDGNGVPGEIADGARWVLNHALGLNSILPVTDALKIFRWSLLIWVAFFIYRLANFIINKLRGSGAAG